jgi:uncharacterized protein YjbI with pentapeptide repeats
VEPEKTPRERAEDLLDLLVSDWRPTPRQVLWAIRIGIILSLLVAIGYSYSITLWDWLKLLIVPAVIAGGGLWFNRQQQERQREDDRQQQERGLEIENQRAQDEALQAYLDQMSQLITDKDRPLRGAQPGDDWSVVARARTLTILKRLDGGRKRSVLEFLYESRLIDREQTLFDGSDLIENQIEMRHTIVSLEDANLSEAILYGANLSGADLSEADLSEAQLLTAGLEGADLGAASLYEANLDMAYLKEANLYGAGLSGADLSNADLSEADLEAADLEGANLEGANLSEVNLRWLRGWTEEQLLAAYSLKGATMPNGQKYEDWLKDKEGRGEEGENSGTS